MRPTLVIFRGLTSARYILRDGESGRALANGLIEGIGQDRSVVAHTVRPARNGAAMPTMLEATYRSEQPIADHDAARAVILAQFAAHGPALDEHPQITDLPDLFAADGVLFDLDGVLTPTAEVHMRAWQAVFDEVFAYWGITPRYSDADYYEFVDGKRRYDGVASLLRSRNMEVPWGAVDDPPDAETICGIGNRKNAAFNDALRAQGIAPYPGSLALVEKLSAAGIPLGVVSSSKNAEQVLAAAGIRSFFRVVVDGVVAERDGLASKPAPDMFRAGAVALGVDPARSIAVEDATSGVASAAAAGFAQVIGVDRGAGAAALRAAGATAIVDDLAVFLPAVPTRAEKR